MSQARMLSVLAQAGQLVEEIDATAWKMSAASSLVPPYFSGIE